MIINESKITPTISFKEILETAKSVNIQVDVIDEDVFVVENIRNLPNEINIRPEVVIFLVCKQGELTCSLNEEIYTVRKNDLLICTPSQIIGHYSISSDFESEIMCLSTRMAHEVFFFERDIWKKLFFVNEHPVIHIDENEFDLSHEFYELLVCKLKQNKKPRRDKIIKHILQALLLELITYVEEKYIVSEKCSRIKQSDILFRRFMELLSNSKVKNRSVSYYADELCVTSKYLSAVCKIVSGKTASKWIKESVIVDVKYLLLSSDKSVKEIVDILGFPSLSFFGKFVKAHLGYSPTEYRHRRRNLND